MRQNQVLTIFEVGDMMEDGSLDSDMGLTEGLYAWTSSNRVYFFNIIRPYGTDAIVFS